MTTHDSFPGLRILNLNDGDDCGFLGTEVSRGQDTHAASLSLLSLVLPTGTRWIGSTCAVVEGEYVDRNFAIAYARVHARAYRDYPRRTTRIHFFNRQIDFEDFFDEEGLQHAYLGYAVLSPVEPVTLGRTYLLPKLQPATEYVTCARADEVNLAGNRLRAFGAPFIEQDQRVSACATAAIWMSTSVIAKNFGEPARSASTADITEMACRYSLGSSGGPFPACGGLSLEQMLWAFHELGLAPVTYRYRDPPLPNQPPAHLRAHTTIYTHVESGIPPVLILSLPSAGGNYHAVTLVGHTYDSSFSPADEALKTGKVSFDSHSWCPRFIGHCDQMGQYLTFEIKPSSKATLGYPAVAALTGGLPDSLEDAVNEFYDGAVLVRVIGPLLPRTDLAPERAAGKGRLLILKAIIEHFQALGLKLPLQLRYRTYLIASNEFKRQMNPSTLPGLSRDLSELYRGHPLSRYVWTTELFADHQQNTPFERLRVLAQAVFEQTSSPDDLDFITLRLPGLFFSMPPGLSGRDKVEEVLKKPLSIQNDQLHAPLIRPTPAD